MLLSTQKLTRSALLLHGIIGIGRAFNHNGCCLELKRLRTRGRKLKRSCYNKRRTHVLSCYFGIILKRFALHNNLKVSKAASVIYGNKTKIFHITNRAQPSGNNYFGLIKRIHIIINGCNFGSIHICISSCYSAPT